MPDAIEAAEELLAKMPPECVLARAGRVGTIVRLPRDGPPAFNLIDATAWVADLRDAAGFLVEVLGFQARQPARRTPPRNAAGRFVAEVPAGFVVATVRGDWRLLRTAEALELANGDGERRSCTIAQAARLLVDGRGSPPTSRR